MDVSTARNNGAASTPSGLGVDRCPSLMRACFGATRKGRTGHPCNQVLREDLPLSPHYQDHSGVELRELGSPPPTRTISRARTGLAEGGCHGRRGFADRRGQ